jgi:hypothetical protein
MRVVGMARGTYAAFAAAVLLITSLAGAALAQELKIFGLTVPERVAGAARGQAEDYEKNHPGGGYGVPFLRKGWRINIFLYDLGRSSIPDDPNSEVIKSHMAQTRDDVFALEKQGHYANVVVRGDYVVKDRGGRTRFVCSTFTYFHKDLGGMVDSYLCLTSWNNKFFKLRVTGLQGTTTRADAERFVRSWIGVLWPS